MVDLAHRRVISASPSSPAFKNSPPIEELGCFDEESCRYFLREVGRRVVPFYPFNFGMEEVYSLILERFGYPGIPDVTSVLQDLLEGEDVAGGLGDDGDIWRSWRHSWRHRNDDTLNPFIPKIGSFVLQAPTEPHIRRIKAQNFIRQCERAGRDNHEQSPQAGPSQPIASDDEDTYTLPATTYAHQRTRTLLASGNLPALNTNIGREQPISDSDSISSAASSQQEFIEVDPSNLDPDVDPSLLVSFEMLTNDPSSPSGYRPSLRGGQAEIITLQQVASSIRSQIGSESHDVEDQESSSRDSSATGLLASDEAEFTGVEQSLPEVAEPTTPDPDVTPAEHEGSSSLEPDESTEDQRVSPEQATSSAGASAGRGPTLSMRTRAMNREFRLIDGAIFHPRARKRVSSQNNNSTAANTGVASRRASVVRRSLTPVLQKLESRQSWLKDTASSVLTLFRRNSQDKLSKSASRKHN